jgi:hypothetical protein
MTDKSAIHNLILVLITAKFTAIDSKTASLDTLYGGLTPQRAGGGHQTKSLRLTDPDKEYVMRAVKKSVGRFYKMLLSKSIHRE